MRGSPEGAPSKPQYIDMVSVVLKYFPRSHSRHDYFLAMKKIQQYLKSKPEAITVYSEKQSTFKNSPKAIFGIFFLYQEFEGRARVKTFGPDWYMLEYLPPGIVFTDRADVIRFDLGHECYDLEGSLWTPQRYFDVFGKEYSRFTAELYSYCRFLEFRIWEKDEVLDVLKSPWYVTKYVESLIRLPKPTAKPIFLNPEKPGPGAMRHIDCILGFSNEEETPKCVAETKSLFQDTLTTVATS